MENKNFKKVADKSSKLLDKTKKIAEEAGKKISETYKTAVEKKDKFMNEKNTVEATNKIKDAGNSLKKLTDEKYAKAADKAIEEIEKSKSK